MNKILWFVLLGVNLGANQSALGSDVTLERIAGELFFENNFLYTYHDLKPVSYGVSIRPTDWKEVLSHRSNYYAWLKLKDIFHNDNFLFIDEPSPYSEDDLSIFFVNKHELLKCLTTHLSLFKRILGEDFDPHRYLKALESGDVPFRKSLKNSEILLGVLLGYGEENSKLYAERCYGHPSHLPRKINEGENEGVGPDRAPLSFINPCRCMGVNSGELHEKFERDYRWVCRQYPNSGSIRKVIEALKVVHKP